MINKFVKIRTLNIVRKMLYFLVTEFASTNGSPQQKENIPVRKPVIAAITNLALAMTETENTVKTT